YLYNSVNHNPAQVAVNSFCLGAAAVAAAVTMGVCMHAGLFWQLPAYILSLSIFHMLEYTITAAYNPQKVTIDSFLFRNGKSYLYAHTFAIAEAIIDLVLFPVGRNPMTQSGTPIISCIGLFFVVIGQVLRSAAMIEASSNFSHIVAHRKADAHVLVKSGVYSVSRHPSYLGYFWWAIGTQLLLLNPLSTLVFACVLQRFFNSRIAGEEKYLQQFFGAEYIDYKKSTPTWIPFIK
ncbi:Isoprenylcysteine carboxyl methyltransferase family-domain-containing protein, partial [Limtongia smithiae]|uniref:Isoprenylcysteine carboxyl methyltransferase family-domain-containing protein n=1 Tax=Limtongia smithiae TaxID=1125753 RepID=UPI0034CF9B66